MARLIKILAASLGGGLVLGAGIRLGEALASGRPERNDQSGVTDGRDEPAAERFARKPAETAGKESRRAAQRDLATSGNNWHQALAGLADRIDRQQADVDAIRRQMSHTAHAVDAVDGFADQLRGDLHRQLSADLDRRLAAVEEKLNASMETGRRETVNALVASIESRLAPRIGRIESDVAAQAQALTELRECSLQSERSIQKLVGVIERVLVAKPGPAEISADDAPRLSVVANRPQDESGTGTTGTRRPASFR